MLGNRWPHKPPLGYGIDFEHPLAQGLIGAWLANEGGGPTLYDLSGNGDNGTLQAGASWSRGPYGPAISLNNSGTGYVTFGSSTTLSPPAITYSCWMRATSFPNSYNTLLCRDSAGHYAQMFATSTGKLAMYISGSVGQCNYAGTGVHTLSAGAWYHAVLAYDSANGLRGYLNGALDGSAAAQGTILSISAATTIGSDTGVAGRYWSGAVDLPMVWNRALSAAEVQQLYSQPFCFVAPRRTQTYYVPLASMISPAGIRRIVAEPPPPELGTVIAIHQSSPAPVVATRIALAASESRQPESGTILAEGGPRAAIPRFDGPPVVASVRAESPWPESGVVLTRYVPTRAGWVPTPLGRMAKTEAPTPDHGSVLSTADHLPAVPLFGAHVPAIIIAAEPQPSYPGSVLDSRRSVLLVGSGYHIYSNSGSGDAINYATPVATASLSATTWTSTGLAAPGSWMFGVRAFNFNGEEQNLDCAVTIVLDATGNDITSRPLPPAGLRAFATPNGSIRAEWYYPSTRGLASPIGFNVYLGTGGTPNYATPAATVLYSAGLLNVFVTNIAGLSDGTTYTVGVRAHNGSGEEQNTITVSVTADAIGPAAVDLLIATAIV